MKQIGNILIAVVVFILLGLLLTGCTVPQCVQTEEQDVFVPEDYMYVKDYWTGFPRRVVTAPSRTEKRTICVKYEDKEIN